jgi:hypothetical protein
MFIKIDKDGRILGHEHVELLNGCNIKIDKSPEQIFDTKLYSYKYKFIDGKLIKCSNEEIVNCPFNAQRSMITKLNEKYNKMKEKLVWQELKKDPTLSSDEVKHIEDKLK